MPAPQTETGELRGPQRLAGPDSRSRHRSAVLVSGRHLDRGFHRYHASLSRSPTSIAARSTPARRDGRPWSPIGTTATSTARRLPAAWTSSSWCRTNTSRRTKSMRQPGALRRAQRAEPAKIVWPANFVTARAYLDQLGRSNALDAKQLAALNDAIAKAEASQA